MMSKQLDDARALIIEEQKKRTGACWQEIQKVLDKHACVLIGAPQFVFAPGVGFTVDVQIKVSVRES